MPPAGWRDGLIIARIDAITFTHCFGAQINSRRSVRCVVGCAVFEPEAEPRGTGEVSRYAGAGRQIQTLLPQPRSVRSGTYDVRSELGFEHDQTGAPDVVGRRNSKVKVGNVLILLAP